MVGVVKPLTLHTRIPIPGEQAKPTRKATQCEGKGKEAGPAELEEGGG